MHVLLYTTYVLLTLQDHQPSILYIDALIEPSVNHSSLAVSLYMYVRSKHAFTNNLFIMYSNDLERQNKREQGMYI